LTYSRNGQKGQRCTHGALDEEYFYYLQSPPIAGEDSWGNSFFAPHIRKKLPFQLHFVPFFVSPKLHKTRAATKEPRLFSGFSTKHYLDDGNRHYLRQVASDQRLIYTSFEFLLSA
jgi:hypothetical protein